MRHNIYHFPALQSPQFLSLSLFHPPSRPLSLSLSLAPNIFFRLSLPSFSILPPSSALTSSFKCGGSGGSLFFPPHRRPLHNAICRLHSCHVLTKRLYGPLSYQLHCGISRLSGLSSGELSVPPPSLCWMLGGQPLSTLFFFSFSFLSLTE